MVSAIEGQGMHHKGLVRLSRSSLSTGSAIVDHINRVPNCALHLQVFLNQVALGPLVTSAVFTWNLLLQNKASEIPQKLKQDLVPTMVNGGPSSFLVICTTFHMLFAFKSVLDL